jgi:hypothetical protein
MLDVDTLKTQ